MQKEDIIDNNIIRKKRKTTETIKKIKKILVNNKIKIIEKKINNLDNKIFSIRIEMKKFSNIGTNGKGLDANSALASAYAEFMERFQTGYLLPIKFLNKEMQINNIDHKKNTSLKNFKKIRFFKDYPIEKFLKLKTINIDESLKKSNELLTLAKFENIINNKKRYLPIDLIKTQCKTNGLCAGNSKKEALSQGICEIYERYCIKEIIYNNIELPNVNLIGINDRILEIIRIIRKYYNCEVKDCSIGKFPVIGLLIYTKDEKKYKFAVGSDPNINIAIQRCITEIFQGNDFLSIENKFIEFNERKIDEGINFLRAFRNNMGMYDKKMLINNKYIDSDSLPFSNKVKTIDDAYNYLIEISIKNNIDIYCKNYSKLGFNTYRVYIPLYSEIEIIDDYKMEYFMNLKLLYDVYYNPIYEKDDNREKFINIMINLAKKGKYGETIKLSKLFNSKGLLKSRYTNLNYVILLLAISLLNKNRNKAIEIIDYFYVSLNDDLKEYMSYVKKELVNEKYESEYREEISLLVHNTKEWLKKFNPPSCPNCKNCFCKKECLYTTWKNEIEKINF